MPGIDSEPSGKVQACLELIGIARNCQGVSGFFFSHVGATQPCAPQGCPGRSMELSPLYNRESRAAHELDRAACPEGEAQWTELRETSRIGVSSQRYNLPLRHSPPRPNPYVGVCVSPQHFSLLATDGKAARHQREVRRFVPDTNHQENGGAPQADHQAERQRRALTPSARPQEL